MSSRYSSEFLMRSLKRLYLYGIPASILFWLLWYKGFAALYAQLLVGLAKALTLGKIDLRYAPETQEIVLPFLLEMTAKGAKYADIGYVVNQWNHSFTAVLLLVVVFWRPKPFRGNLRLAFLTFVLLMSYHLMAMGLTLWEEYLGPNLPNRYQIMWEHRDVWYYPLIAKGAAFNTLVGRYWAGFPVYGLAFLFDWFFFRQRNKN